MRSLSLLIGFLAVIMAFSILLSMIEVDAPGPKQPSNTERVVAEPVSLIVDLDIKAATMADIARQYSRQTGVRFILARPLLGQRKLPEPYSFNLPQQDLKGHLDDINRNGLLRITWQENHYVIEVAEN